MVATPHFPQRWMFLKWFKNGSTSCHSLARFLKRPKSGCRESNIQFIPFVLSIFGKLGGEGDHFQHLASCFRPARPRVRQRPTRGNPVHAATTNGAAGRSRANAASRKKQVTVAPTPPESSLQLPTCSTARASTSTAISDIVCLLVSFTFSLTLPLSFIPLHPVIVSCVSEYACGVLS